MTGFVTKYVTRLEQLHEVLIDAADEAFYDRHVWHLSGGGYVVRNCYVDGKRGQSKLHRDLLGLVKGDQNVVDHINRNPLDNRRANLRLVEVWENAQNRGPSRTSDTGKRGVWYDAINDRWMAQHRYRGTRWTKSFRTEAEAVAGVRAQRALRGVEVADV